MGKVLFWKLWTRLQSDHGLSPIDADQGSDLVSFSMPKSIAFQLSRL